jgi:hypothetical protein
MVGLKKRLKKSFAKAKPVFKKGKRFAKKTLRNIDDYFELDRKQALKMKPRVQK